MDLLGRFDDEISRAWQAAESDLGIRVVAPYEISVESCKTLVEAYIPDFGGPNGAVALSKMTSHHEKAILKLGYFPSILFPSYRSYLREHFIDTLNDWQWFGSPDEKPDWYTGKSWS